MVRPSFPRKETFARLVIPAKAGIQPPLPLGEGWGEESPLHNAFNSESTLARRPANRSICRAASS